MMIGPPDAATLEEWRDAFVRENKLRMALLAALDLLVTEMKDFGDDHVTFYAGQLAAELAKHRGP